MGRNDQFPFEIQLKSFLNLIRQLLNHWNCVIISLGWVNGNEKFPFKSIVVGLFIYLFIFCFRFCRSNWSAWLPFLGETVGNNQIWNLTSVETELVSLKHGSLRDMCSVDGDLPVFCFTSYKHHGCRWIFKKKWWSVNWWFGFRASEKKHSWRRVWNTRLSRHLDRRSHFVCYWRN